MKIMAGQQKVPIDANKLLDVLVGVIAIAKICRGAESPEDCSDETESILGKSIPSDGTRIKLSDIDPEKALVTTMKYALAILGENHRPEPVGPVSSN